MVWTWMKRPVKMKAINQARNDGGLVNYDNENEGKWMHLKFIIERLNEYKEWRKDKYNPQVSISATGWQLLKWKRGEWTDLSEIMFGFGLLNLRCKWALMKELSKATGQKTLAYSKGLGWIVWCQETELFYKSGFSQKAVNLRDLYETLVYRGEQEQVYSCNTNKCD